MPLRRCASQPRGRRHERRRGKTRRRHHRCLSGARSPGLARAEVAGGAFWCDPVTPSSIVGSPRGRDARSAAAG